MIELLSDPAEVETIAAGRGIRELARLRRVYGPGRWRKRKGVALVRVGRGESLYAELHWYEADLEGLAMGHSRSRRTYVVCLDNRGYRASLVVRRIYARLPDPEAAKHALLRVVDESGEDYLYPRSLFADVKLPEAAGRALASMS